MICVSIISLPILFYMGGMANTLLSCIAHKSKERVGWYGVIFISVYWLPLGIEWILDKRNQS